MVVLCGVGKSALVAQRIAATLTVVGIPSRFLSPTDAVHGDVGSLGGHDLLFLVTRSGETEELVRMLAVLEPCMQSLIILTSYPASTLGCRADLVLEVPGDEACPHGLVPTSSSTAAGVMGDALAMVLQQVLGRTAEDFAALHAGGTLGRRLTLRVKDVMVTGDDVGRINDQDSLAYALVQLAHKRGTLIVVDAQQPSEDNIVGVVTAGDVARFVASADSANGESVGEWTTAPVNIVTQRHPQTAAPGALVVDAIEQMQVHGVMALPVMEECVSGETLVGMLHLHDALRVGVQ